MLKEFYLYFFFKAKMTVLTCQYNRDDDQVYKPDFYLTYIKYNAWHRLVIYSLKVTECGTI